MKISPHTVNCMILFRPNVFRIFSVTVLTKDIYSDFQISFVFKLEFTIVAMQRENEKKMPKSWEWLLVERNEVKFGNRGCPYMEDL